MRGLAWLLKLSGTIGIVAIQSVAFAQGSSIRVLSDGPLRPALLPIAEVFRRHTGQGVDYVFGTSPAIHKKILGGENADVLIIQPSFVAELVKSGKVVAGSQAPIGRVGFGLAARAGSAAHDVSSVQGFKQALLNSDTLIFNNVASGNYFATVLDRLSIGEAVKAKVVRIPPAAVFERVKKGKGRDLGVGTIPQISADKGLQLVGPFPRELQSYISYTASAMRDARAPKTAEAFIAFLNSREAKDILAANGVEAGVDR